MFKKMIKGLGVFVTFFAFANVAKAAQVDVIDENSLRECVQTNNNICVLKENIQMTNSNIIIPEGNTITIDLNGKEITENSLNLSKGLFEISNNANLTMKDSSNGQGKVEAKTCYAALQVRANSKLTVENGTYLAKWYAISGNGTEHNTEITINNGTFKALETNEAPGIYHPQNGTLTINGGYIEGTLGIEIRAGKLIVNGGTIVGTAKPSTVNPNGSGTTTEGVGIAIAQHTTKLNTEVIINGGTIKGFTAVYQSNPQNNNQEAIDKVNISINGGNFEATQDGTLAIYSENKTGFIKGGSFNTDVTEYLSNLYKLELKDGVYKAIENKQLEITDNQTGETIAKLETETPLPNDYRLVIEENNNIVNEQILNETQKLVAENLKNLTFKNLDILKTYDIYVLDSQNEIVEMKNGKYYISVKVDEKLLKQYKYFKVVYIDENGKVTELLDAKVNNNMVTFVTTHLSTYSVVGYNADENIIDEETNPKTNDNIISYFIISAFSLAIIALAVKGLKESNN